MKKAVPFLFILFVILAIKPKPEVDFTLKGGYSWEEYDASLVTKLQSVNDIILNADATVGKENRHTLQYAEHIADLLRKRFYHGYSHYSYTENPIMAFLGDVVWDHLSALVIPDEILKHPNAACSQQAIVLMECFKRIGVDFRAVFFEHHYTLEANINGKWYYFDTNVEPIFLTGRKSVEELLNEKVLLSAYSDVENRKDDLDFQTAIKKAVTYKISYRKINAAPAPNAVILHTASLMLLHIIFLMLAFYSFKLLYKKIM